MTISGRAVTTAAASAPASNTSTTTGTTPNSRSSGTLAAVRVVPVTSCPPGRSSEASRRPTTPVAPARKILMRAPSHRVMAYCLDPVAVGIAQERCIIRRVMVAQARRAVVGAAGGNVRIPERIDLGPPLRLAAPPAADGVVRLRTRADGEIDAVRMRGARPFAIAEPAVAAADLDDVERLHDGVVEPLGRGDVGYRDGDVVQHSSLR